MDHVSKKRRSEIMARIRAKDTKPELIVRRLAHAMGFRYRLHVRSLAGTPDLVFRRKKKAIFVHGCFWHGHSCPRGSVPSTNVKFWNDKIFANQARDLRAHELLSDEHWSVLTMWECELKDIEHVRKELIRFLSDSKRPKKRKVTEK